MYRVIGEIWILRSRRLFKDDFSTSKKIWIYPLKHNYRPLLLIFWNIWSTYYLKIWCEEVVLISFLIIRNFTADNSERLWLLLGKVIHKHNSYDFSSQKDEKKDFFLNIYVVFGRQFSPFLHTFSSKMLE